MIAPRSENWGRGSTRRRRRERLTVLGRDPICYLQLAGCTQISTIDEHVIGRAAGGTDSLDNRRGACAACNEAKRQGEALAGRRTATKTRAAEKHPGLR